MDLPNDKKNDKKKQKLFIEDEEEFFIEFFVGTKESGELGCSLEEKEVSEYDDVEKYKVVFKRPSFGDSIGLYDSIFSISGTSPNVEFNPLASRYKKITSLIKSWNLMDEEPTEKTVRKLHPSIANLIGMELDIETGGIFT